MRRLHPGAVVIFVLAAVGLVVMLIQNPGGFFIPVIVLGLIFLLYKFPPSRLRSQVADRRSSKRQQPSAKPKSARKNIPFRVIEGGKDDDDDVPKYH
ncbi:hypothetical protein AB6A23_15875 [Paenibacillus tarimensis]